MTKSPTAFLMELTPLSRSEDTPTHHLVTPQVMGKPGLTEAVGPACPREDQ